MTLTGILGYNEGSQSIKRCWCKAAMSLFAEAVSLTARVQIDVVMVISKTGTEAKRQADGVPAVWRVGALSANARESG